LECTRVRELISEYIDDTLDAGVRVAVEEHISTCSKGCKEELAEVSSLVAQLGSLEPVKPPADLLEKVHEGIDLGYGFQRIFRKLFVPFRIKIPLELAGAAIVAILVVAVFLNIQQTEEETPRIPRVTMRKKAALKPPVEQLEKGLKQEAQMPAPVIEKRPGKRSGIEDAAVDRKSVETPMKSLTPSAPGKERVGVSGMEAKMAAPVLEDSEEMRSGIDDMLVVQKSPEVPMKAVVTKVVEPPPAVSHKRKAVVSVRARKPIELVLVIKRELIDKIPRSHMAMQTEITKQIEVPDDEAVRTPPPSSHEEAATRQAESLIHLIRLANGKVLDVKYDRQTDRYYSFSVEIHADQYEPFTEGLGRLGTLRTTPPGLTEKDRETVRIRVNLESPE
jgi:hypothetical protein